MLPAKYARQEHDPSAKTLRMAITHSGRLEITVGRPKVNQDSFCFAHLLTNALPALHQVGESQGGMLPAKNATLPLPILYRGTLLIGNSVTF